MAKEPKNWVWAFAFTLSLSLHVLLGGRDSAEAAEPTFEHPEPKSVELVWLDTTLEAEPAPPEPALESAPEPVLERTTRPSRVRRPREIHPRETQATTDSPAASESSSATASSSSSTSGEVARGELDGEMEAMTPTIDVARLQPAAVARGTFGPRVPSAEEERAALESALEADLYQLANAAPYDTVRPAPELRATGDGGYTYDGHLFDASISPSGEVTFDDAPPIGFSGLGGPSGTLGVGFSFDISAAAERAAGNDPHAAERRWFMEETRRVRERLAGQARAQIQGRGLVRLRRRLRAIWGADKPIAERRDEVFRVWDSCEEDEVGAEARAAILEFILSHPGADRADVFPTEQLRRLNASRVSRERFDPYHATYEE